MKLARRVQMYGPASCSGEGAHRERVILFIYLHLNAITLVDLSHNQRLLRHMHTNFLALTVLDDIVAIIEAHQIPLDHFGLFEAGRSVPIEGVRPLGQPEAQHSTTPHVKTLTTLEIESMNASSVRE